MIDAILRAIGQGRTFLVASHAHPDGDAVGSTLGLVNCLRDLGREAVAFNLDNVPANFAFLPGAQSLLCRPEDLGRYDVGFVLDSGELSRAGSFLPLHCRQVISIDHHPCSERFGDINYVDEQACATGALVYRIIHAAGFPVSADVALCLYTAILSDTGSFRYSNANPEAFQIASSLVACGISPWYVAENLYESRPAEQLRLLAIVLETLAISPCGRFGSVCVTRDMLLSAGAKPEDTDGLINYPRSVRGVEVALCFRQTDDNRFKVSFRSKGKVDVGALARGLGGGGHHNAAGATVDGDIGQVKCQVFARLNELLPFS
ncbi:DHH family phosphoesterase [Syntrophotalea acetylenica]|uniref:Phosphoesterase n=1 Tax=Syntrophotalea acetylenica TaxID=29542 RepID=A0A1L3GIW5_SYNAC|nr:bifunctional oligoribonuclease/PAP phosphatase NrnA [Syntrophotalea acetylenica]APG25886.1 phosphoesterase [Syntrophotalea acetylenica]APG43958.1 phosphoesterase [Syntrophotalea acetylenica]